MDAGCRWGRTSYISSNTSMYLELKANSSFTNYTVHRSNTSTAVSPTTVCYSSVCCEMIHTLRGRTEIPQVGSDGVKPTAAGLRIQPIDEIVYPRGCWDSQVGSDKNQGGKINRFQTRFQAVIYHFNIT